MEGPTDQETITIGKIACYIYRSQEERTCHATGTTRGSTGVSLEAKGMSRKCKQEDLMWFPLEGIDKIG